AAIAAIARSPSTPGMNTPKPKLASVRSTQKTTEVKQNEQRPQEAGVGKYLNVDLAITNIRYVNAVATR
ncbi:MAG TPA: hypothetical protein VF263_00250, partial [Longimicrobiaceae bacterium]